MKTIQSLAILVSILLNLYALNAKENDPVSQSIKIVATDLTSLTGCSLSPDSLFINKASDGTSVLLGDSIDFGDGRFYNEIEVVFSVTYGEIYGQRSGELDFYLDNDSIPFASVRKPMPVIWDTCYTIKKVIKPIKGIHQVKVVWDWYTANLKNVTFSKSVEAIPDQQKEIKIACLGNSITEGTEAGDRVNKGYAGLLQQMLGEGYQVRNYGSSGATACRNTYNPFSQGKFCKSALSFEPDIITICLGTNDSQPGVWNTDSFAINFETDLIYLIDLFACLDSHPEIYLCLPPPIFPNDRWGHQSAVVAGEIIPKIKEIAEQKGLEIIDLYSPLINHKECYAPEDLLHPIATGHKIMAKQIYNKLTGK